ncbi:MAG TPA: TIGR03790 family protein [Opitutaceae bacterium]|nr:TIGR03790 family protein [Opitutaceae bacterium]
MSPQIRRLLPRARWCGVALLIVATTMRLAAASGGPGGHVVILANSDDPDSMRVARHYAEVRRVPLENIIARKMSSAEIISWREFVATIWEPLREELVARKWIDAIPIAVTDYLGRKKYATNGHQIAAVVVCRGVPLKIVHEPDFYAEHQPFTNRQEFRSNAGAVDSELSLLPGSSYSINAFVPNPLYRNENPTGADRAQVVPVGRLDGPTVEHALALVDHAVETERTGLIGRAYVDIGGIYRDGDQWFEAVAAQLEGLAFDIGVDRSGSTLPATARFDAPALYFGWYTTDLNGPFALSGFQFPAGAFAFHLHSFSAGTMRSESSGWSAPFVARGVTGTIGNVYEPYLALTHRPDLLIRALIRGASLGEAACYSVPAFSWQPILLGDPLYRPFAVAFEDQWKNRANLPPKLAGYVVVRRMRFMEAAGKRSEALALGRAEHQRAPSLALAVGLAQRLQATGDAPGAAQVLEFVPGLKTPGTDEWALTREAAQLLAANGGSIGAVEVYQTLFAVKNLPAELRLVWLPEAVKAARFAHNSSQAAAWEKEHADISAQIAAKK